MTQWLLEQKLVALNTVYKKAPQKQVTYRTPKGVEKQLDYILTDKNHYCWSRDAEANDMIHMRSDHRCVMRRFVIPAKAKKKTWLNETTPKTERKARCKEHVEEVQETQDEHGFEARYIDLEQEVKSAEPAEANKSSKRRKDAAAAKAAAATAAAISDAKKEAAADDETKKVEKEAEAAKATAETSTKEDEDKDKEVLAFIHERRTIQKEEKERIREASKKIKKCIREKRGRQDQKTSWKNSKERRTHRMSNQQKNEFSSRRSRT